MTNSPSGALTKTPVRIRRLRGLSDTQTLQRQPTTGTPILVPVPMTTSSAVVVCLVGRLGSAADN